MTALLPPARFLSTVDEGLLASDRHADDWDRDSTTSDGNSNGVKGFRDILPLRHDYLHSLIFANRWGAGKGYSAAGKSGHRRSTVSERELEIEGAADDCGAAIGFEEGGKAFEVVLGAFRVLAEDGGGDGGEGGWVRDCGAE